MKIKDVIRTLEDFAPLPLQEDYDNAGLQTGLTEAEVSGVLLCLDVTEDIIEEAVAKGCNTVVSHHPLIFRRLSHVSDGNMVERCVRNAIRHDVNIISMHTNLDSARGGVNFMIARHMGLKPETLEIIDQRTVDGVDGGNAVIGELPEPLTTEQYVELLKREFHAQCVMTNEPLKRSIKRVAICGGAGSFMLGKAIEHGADAFLTGEMHYHEYFDHGQQVLISVIGHYENEQYTKELLQEILKEKYPDLKTVVTEQDTNPIKYWK